MIISCEQCHKKFEIDSNLIPKSGRLLKCGSCNYQWFFVEQIIKKITPENNEVDLDNNDLEIKPISSFEKNDELKIKEKIDQNEKLEIKSNKIRAQDHSEKEKTLTKKSGISILNIIIIFIISIISLILIIDTFKRPISFIIPNIEYVLYSLYETLKDIGLFFNDLYN